MVKELQYRDPHAEVLSLVEAAKGSRPGSGRSLDTKSGVMHTKLLYTSGIYQLEIAVFGQEDNVYKYLWPCTLDILDSDCLSSQALCRSQLALHMDDLYSKRDQAHVDI